MPKLWLSFLNTFALSVKASFDQKFSSFTGDMYMFSTFKNSII